MSTEKKEAEVLTGAVDLEGVSSGGRAYIPRNSYGFVCVACEKKPSRAGKPMLVFTHELVDPETIVHNDAPVAIGGTQVQQYLSLNEYAPSTLKDMHKCMGLPMKFDADNPDTTVYFGKGFEAICSTEAAVEKREGTNDPILDADGKPITTNQYRLSKFISRREDLDRALPY